jgi:hypothetical protein
LPQLGDPLVLTFQLLPQLVHLGREPVGLGGGFAGCRSRGALLWDVGGWWRGWGVNGRLAGDLGHDLVEGLGRIGRVHLDQRMVLPGVVALCVRAVDTHGSAPGAQFRQQPAQRTTCCLVSQSHEVGVSADPRLQLAQVDQWLVSVPTRRAHHYQ